MTSAAARSPQLEDFPMSPRENVMRLIAQLPDEKIDELERLVIAMLPADVAAGVDRARLLAALAHVNQEHGSVLERLAQ